MSTPTALDELAARAGIEPYYHDVWGERHALSLDTKRMFLAAMGLSAASEEQAAQLLAAFASRLWRRALEPVTVLREGSKDWAADIICDAARAGSVTWCVVTEDGTRYEGSLSLASLPVAETQSVDGRPLERRLLALPESLPLGYHRLDVAGDALPGGVGDAVPGGADGAALMVAPPHAYLPETLQHPPGIWGVNLQLYGLQGRESWGIGDFSDLAGFANEASSLGIGALGLNPLHALFPGNPAHASPYSPSSRSFLNPLYIDIAAVPDFAECREVRDQLQSAAFRASLGALRATPLVDYVAVAAAKRPMLERLYSAFRSNHLERGTARAEAFRRFQRAGGTALERYATFEALAEHFHKGETWHLPWRQWPAPYRDPNTPDTAAFARDHAARVTFHQYLQWEADRQLSAAAKACRHGGMSVGLYRDLALGIDADGAEAWAEQKLVAEGISTGAPPDPFNLKGQSWGLPPFNPHALREAAYRPFIECLRANMRHAGALRLDHVMGFARLFWIPGGAPPSEGGYVRYPLDEMLAVTALESQRARCTVVGEDLGTVPDEVREALHRCGILSYRLLYFEQDRNGRMRKPDEYPRDALASATTHDLPTLAGFWLGRDIEARRSAGLLPDDAAYRQMLADRSREKQKMLDVFTELRLLPEWFPRNANDVPELTGELHNAVVGFLASTPSKLMVLNQEDLLKETEQQNLPGSTAEYPNWRRKMRCTVEELWESPEVQAFTRMFHGWLERSGRVNSINTG